jgi:FMN phosphatase YigB (HAD superfamily)
MKGSNMINTILFDLDGTLLPIELEDFQNVYLSALTRKFSDLVEPKELIKMIMASTKKMVQNTDKIKNEFVFMDTLKSFIGEDDLKVYQERFLDFYNNEFIALKDVIRPNLEIREAVTLLKEKGYELIVATNPMFPQIAIEKRIEWAGFDPSEFIYMSTFEKNHYCKPNLDYYKEVLADNQKSPYECMMVGNDPFEDLIASKLGLKTYLITNHLVQREHSLNADYRGEYHDFLTFVKAMPTVESDGK